MIHILYILAVWRLTNLIYAESGPFDLFEHFRRLLCRWDMPKKMLGCPLCVSVWCSGCLGLLYLSGWHWPAMVLGWSGAVCLLYIILEMGHKATNWSVKKYNHEVFKE